MALVAWYKLDGNALDSSGNGLHGTSSSTTWESGKIGEAARFNGSGYISIAHNDKFNLHSQGTLSAWVRPNRDYPSDTTSTAYRGIMGKVYGGGSGQQSFFIDWHGTNSSRNLRGAIGDSLGSNAVQVPYNFEQRWTHVLLSWDGEFLSLYANGTLLGQTPQTRSCQELANNFTIGYPFTAWDGWIDDVRVYDHALSPKEVKELAKAKILHYRMDDFQEPTINLMPATCDYGDFENDARTSIGVYNNGSSSGVVVTHSIVSAVAEGIPKPPNGSDKVLKITVDNTVGYTGNVGWYLMTNSTHGTTCLANKQYTQSAWMLMPKEITAQGFTNNSGITNNTIIRPAPDGSSWKHYSRTFTVGTSNYTGGLHYYAKMPGQVYSFYMDMHQLEEKPYATEYAKGERSGTVHDSSGYDNHAELALATTPRWTDDTKIGSGAYEFDGTNDGIKCSRTFLNPDSDYTFSCWFKWGGSGGGSDGRRFIAETYPADGNYMISVWVGGGSSPKITTASTLGNITCSTTIQPNVWYHLALVLDQKTSPKQIKVYLNGKLDGSGTSSSAFYIQGLNIGTYRDFNNRWFHGSIDDVRVYATALSDADILELYQTRGNIDSHGNLYVQEVLETGHKPLIADYTVWQDGQTGSISPFTQHGSRNRRILGYDPWGKQTVLWESYSNAPLDSGGIRLNSFPIDNTKMYRFSVWERRIANGATHAHYYFGLYGYGATNGVKNASSGTVTTNPYFTSGSMTSGVVNSMREQWVLHVGHIFPHNYAGGAHHPESGRYTKDGLIGNISSYQWLPETTTATFRTYTIYSTTGYDTTGAIHHSVYPRIDICDGTEPSIQELLDGFDSRYIDYVRAKGGANPITLDVGDKSSTFGNISELGPMNGIIAWWSLDGHTDDYSGNNNHGTNNGATITSGIRGSAYSFDGSADQFIDISGHGLHLSEMYNGGATFSCWIKPNIQQTRIAQNIAGFLYFIINASGKLQIMTRDVKSNANEWVYGVKTIPVGEWSHVVCVLEDGVGGKFYVNGEIDGVKNNDGVGIINRDTASRLGWYYDSSLNGVMTDARIYNRALSPEEIKILYDVTKPNAIPMQLSNDGTVYLAGELKEA